MAAPAWSARPAGSDRAPRRSAARRAGCRAAGSRSARIGGQPAGFGRTGRRGRRCGVEVVVMAVAGTRVTVAVSAEHPPQASHRLVQVVHRAGEGEPGMVRGLRMAEVAPRRQRDVGAASSPCRRSGCRARGPGCRTRHRRRRRAHWHRQAERFQRRHDEVAPGLHRAAALLAQRQRVGSKQASAACCATVEAQM